jgi:hypothetical protein
MSHVAASGSQKARQALKFIIACNVLSYHLYLQSSGSSVSIVSHYRLVDWVTEVQSPAEAKDFSSSFCVQTSSEANPAPYPTGTGVPSLEVKGSLCMDADHSPSSSAEVKNK